MATTDWDFQHTNWELDTGAYQSSPSSIKWNGGTSQGVRLAALYKGDLLIKEGQVIWWMKQNGANNPGICFRNQAADGSASDTNCYFVYIGNPTARLAIDVAGNISGVGAVFDDSAWTNNTWRKFKIAWWDSYNAQNKWSLTAQLWEWDGSWVSRGVRYDDDNSQWEDSGTNRVGIITGWNASSPRYDWWDDVELYEA